MADNYGGRGSFITFISSHKAVLQVLGLSDYCENRIGYVLGSSKPNFAVLPWSTVVSVVKLPPTAHTYNYASIYCTLDIYNSL